MAIRLPSYLHQNRCGMFGFRVVIPTDLRIFFRATEHRITLKTSDRRIAKRLAVGLVAFSTNYFERLRFMSKTTPKINEDFFGELMAERERLGNDLLNNLGATTIEGKISVFGHLASTLDDGPVKSVTLRLIDLLEAQQCVETQKIKIIKEMAEHFATHPEEDPDAYSLDTFVELARLKTQESQIALQLHELGSKMREWHLLQASQGVVQSAEEEFSAERHKLADFVSLVVSKNANASGSIPGGSVLPTAPAAPQTPLSTVIDEYCESSIREGQWKPKTADENRAIFDLWLRIVGDQPIVDYKAARHREYRSTLLRLPPNLNKLPRYRGKSIQEIIALGDPPVAPNTINKHLNRIAALFKWAESFEYVSHNPTGSMTIKNPKRANEERLAFSSDDPRKLFHSPDYLHRKHRTPYMYWAPLLALHSGARQSEIAQLHLSDFDAMQGIPVIRISPGGEGKSVKTGAGTPS